MSPEYEREDGPRRTRLDLTAAPAPVEFTVRARIQAWQATGSSMYADEIPVFECNRCPGVVIWGDRLHVHREWHQVLDARGPDSGRAR